MTFKQLQDMVKTHLVFQSPDTNVLTEIKAAINRKYRAVVSIIPDAPVLNREVSVVSLAKLTGSVATVTGGSRLVNLGEDAGQDRRYIDAFIKFGEEDESYRVIDVTVENQQTSQAPRLVIDPPYTGLADGSSSSADTTWEMLQLDYPLPRDVMRIISVRMSSISTRTLHQVDQSDLELRWPDPLVQGLVGSEPHVWADTGRTNYDFWSTDLDNRFFAVEGVVDITNDSVTVSPDGTTTPLWFSHLVSNRDDDNHTNYFIGKDFQVEGDERSYEIQRFTHTATGDSTGDSITLKDPYKGTTVSDGRYVIGARNLRRIRVFPIPDTVQHIEVRYRRLPVDLVDDNDVPEISEEHHHVIALLSSAELLMSLGGDTPSEIAKSQQFQALAERAMENMFRETNSIEGRILQLRRSWVTPDAFNPRFSVPNLVTVTS